MDDIKRWADLSVCREYRYALWREWAGCKGYVLFICLNPSTADESKDDPTSKRCIAFAKAWGYSGMCIANLFAYRATNPMDMKLAPDPVGPDNDHFLRTWASQSQLVVAAWGAHGSFKGRDKHVKHMLGHMSCLHVTKDGHPGHPLYLPAALKPVRWN